MTTANSLNWRWTIPPMLVALSPGLAAAHTGVGASGGFLPGLTHPLSGLDHLGAMIGVGLWAAQRGGRASWLVPLTFVAVMMLGGLLGMAGCYVPVVDTGIAASLLILGVLIAAAVRMPLAASVCVVGLFALFHGHAHGTEIPAAASGLLYGLGFITTTALLHACGVGLGCTTCKMGAAWMARYAGAAIALCGLYLCLA